MFPPCSAHPLEISAFLRQVPIGLSARAMLVNDNIPSWEKNIF
jgi:hypothetical protein